MVSLIIQNPVTPLVNFLLILRLPITLLKVANARVGTIDLLTCTMLEDEPTNGNNK
jgi:hypothetical protein